MLKIIFLTLLLVVFVKSLDPLNLDRACDTCAGYNVKNVCEKNPDITSDTVIIYLSNKNIHLSFVYSKGKHN